MRSLECLFLSLMRICGRYFIVSKNISDSKAHAYLLQLRQDLGYGFHGFGNGAFLVIARDYYGDAGLRSVFQVFIAFR